MTHGGPRIRRALTGLAVGIGLLAAPGISAFQSSATAATVPFTGAYFDSEHGEYIGLGQQWTFPSVTSIGSAIDPEFTLSNGVTSFTVGFSAPTPNTELLPGTYNNATRNRVPNPSPGLDLWGDGRGCNTVAGQFIVDDATYDAAGHALTFAVRFEANCGGVGPKIFGYISYNSTAPERIRTLSANTISFPGSPGLAVHEQLTISNAGPASDTPTGFTITGPDANYFSIVGTTCGTALPAGGSCAVTVSYTEAVINQTASATLMFTDQLAPAGPPNEPGGVGRGRSIGLNGTAALGTITGTVTGVGGVPLAGVCVEYSAPGQTQFVPSSSKSGANGTYSITLQPGIYALWFVPGTDCSGEPLSPYAPQLYKNAADVTTDIPVVVVGGQTTSGINVQLVIGGYINGRVTDSTGAPIPQVQVTVTPLGAEPWVGKTVITDANGAYTIYPLAAESYSVKYVYWPTFTTIAMQWYSGSTDQTKVTPVCVSAGQVTTGINAMFPTPTTGSGGVTGGCGTSGGTGGGIGGGGGTGSGSGTGGGTGGGGTVWGSGPTCGTDTSTPEPGPLSRVAGVDRIGTAVAASKGSFPTGNARAVVLADAMNYPDALVGAPLAAAKNAPLLLSDGDLLPASTFAELKRVLPAGRTVYLLGGTGAIPSSAADELVSAGYRVVRYSGADRYATAAAVAAALGNPSTVLLANGTGFSDALAAGPAAAHVHGAVLLTDGPTLPVGTADYLSANHPTVYAVGGDAATADPAARPIVGTDRFATAADVATTFFAIPTQLGFAIGTAFPDALSGGAQLALADAPLLLVTGVGVPAPTSAYIAAHSSATTGYLYGGAAVLNGAVMSELDAAISGS